MLLVSLGEEHVSILFASAAQAAARDWLDGTFGPQPDALTYADRRVLWYGLGLLAALLVAVAWAPLVTVPAPASIPHRPLWQHLGALAGGAFGATLVLWLAGGAGLALRSLSCLLVGGYLLIWFGVAGVLSLLLLSRIRPSPRTRTWPCVSAPSSAFSASFYRCSPSSSGYTLWPRLHTGGVGHSP